MQIEKCIFIKQAVWHLQLSGPLNTGIMSKEKNKKKFNQFCDSTKGSEPNQVGKDLRRFLVQLSGIQPKYFGFYPIFHPPCGFQQEKIFHWCSWNHWKAGKNLKNHLDPGSPPSSAVVLGSRHQNLIFPSPFLNFKTNWVGFFFWAAPLNQFNAVFNNPLFMQNSKSHPKNN